MNDEKVGELMLYFQNLNLSSQPWWWQVFTVSGLVTEGKDRMIIINVL